MNTKTICTFLVFAVPVTFSLNAQPLSANLNTSATTEHVTAPEKPFEYQLQNYNIQQLENDLQEFENHQIQNHYLGNEIARLYSFFEASYTFYSKAAPGAFSDTKSIKKPEIYFCINKLDKYYRKEVKKGSLSEDLARLEFKTYLQSALLLLHENTTDFQKEASQAHKPSEIQALFGRVKFN